MTIAVTGHRPSDLGGEWLMKGPVSGALKEKFREIIKIKKPELGICGMALGADIIWAFACIMEKVPFIAVIPFPSFPNKWNPEQQNIFFKVLNEAQETVYIQRGFSIEAYQRRNIYMVDSLAAPEDRLIAVYNGKGKGGTFNTIQYATEKRKEIIYINPNKL